MHLFRTLLVLITDFDYLPCSRRASELVDVFPRVSLTKVPGFVIKLFFPVSFCFREIITYAYTLFNASFYLSLWVALKILDLFPLQIKWPVVSWLCPCKSYFPSLIVFIISPTCSKWHILRVICSGHAHAGLHAVLSLFPQDHKL